LISVRLKVTRGPRTMTVYCGPVLVLRHPAVLLPPRWPSMVAWQVLSRLSAAEGGGRRPVFVCQAWTLDWRCKSSAEQVGNNRKPQATARRWGRRETIWPGPISVARNATPKIQPRSEWYWGRERAISRRQGREDFCHPLGPGECAFRSPSLAVGRRKATEEAFERGAPRGQSCRQPSH
jgi:hypothetical protein